MSLFIFSKGDPPPPTHKQTHLLQFLSDEKRCLLNANKVMINLQPWFILDPDIMNDKLSLQKSTKVKQKWTVFNNTNK